MMKTLIAQYIDQNQLLEPGERVLVGLSGGMDSVVLTHLLVSLGFQVTAAHVNYRLRGSESDWDEQFVREFCSELRIPVEIYHPEPRNPETPSVQEWARDIRYSFFETLAGSKSIHRVAVAHNRDDQAETVLLHLFRGTGVEGLAGMPAGRPIWQGSTVTLIRPLLFASRSELVSYAEKEGMSWREDGSNAHPKYLRNRLRNELFPQIEEVFGGRVRDHIARAADQVRGYLEESWKSGLAEEVDVCRLEKDGYSAIDLSAWLQLPETHRMRVLLAVLRDWFPDHEWTSKQLNIVAHLTTLQTGRKVVFKGGEIWKARKMLVFVPEQEKSPLAIEISGVGEYSFGNKKLRVSESVFDETADRPERVQLNKSRLVFPLILRSWRAGDSFRPMGMTGNKSIADFLTDVKIPTYQKQDIPVLIDADQNIVWVVPLRLSELVRAKAGQPVLVFSIHDSTETAG